ncbi:hypothetical protein NHX12_033908 [Muraenolepis orangiensis]|uniref:Uncharacterized protein n=1 Tax=Muraenolepis orangiensis TaxID=630683 RepID=A0A9Q0E615_9TELE|nr:hypothetical protein NHX12_033908 [Muraenolepis orangiensis]
MSPLVVVGPLPEHMDGPYLRRANVCWSHLRLGSAPLSLGIREEPQRNHRGETGGTQVLVVLIVSSRNATRPQTATRGGAFRFGLSLNGTKRLCVLPASTVCRAFVSVEQTHTIVAFTQPAHNSTGKGRKWKREVKEERARRIEEGGQGRAKGRGEERGRDEVDRRRGERREVGVGERRGEGERRGGEGERREVGVGERRERRGRDEEERGRKEEERGELRGGRKGEERRGEGEEEVGTQHRGLDGR